MRQSEPLSDVTMMRFEKVEFKLNSDCVVLGKNDSTLKILRFGKTVVPVQVRPGAPKSTINALNTGRISSRGAALRSQSFGHVAFTMLIQFATLRDRQGHQKTASDVTMMRLFDRVNRCGGIGLRTFKAVI